MTSLARKSTRSWGKEAKDWNLCVRETHCMFNKGQHCWVLLCQVSSGTGWRVCSWASLSHTKRLLMERAIFKTCRSLQGAGTPVTVIGTPQTHTTNIKSRDLQRFLWQRLHSRQLFRYHLISWWHKPPVFLPFLPTFILHWCHAQTCTDNTFTYYKAFSLGLF